MKLVLGIDGGGTHTRAVLADTTGAVLGTGKAGPGNFHDVTRDQLGAHLAEACRKAFADAGRVQEPLAACFLGLAGVSLEDERRQAKQVAARAIPAHQHHVDHDLRVALAGGLGGQPGIVLIVGTGSSCYGRRADGATWKAAGWGSVLDDPGSAFDLGRRALMALLQAYDGRGPATCLSRTVMAALGLQELREIRGLLQGGLLRRHQVARLAPCVTAAAEDGDPVARTILEVGTQELAKAVVAVAERLEWTAPQVTCTGGLARSGPTYGQALAQALASAVPGVRLVTPLLSPARGAVLLALGLLGQQPNPDLLRRLRSGEADCRSAPGAAPHRPGSS